MTTLRWSTGLTIFLWCQTLPRVSWITRWRLPVSRWRILSTCQQRRATTVWQVLRWFWTGWNTDRYPVWPAITPVSIAERWLTTWSPTTCPAHCLLSSVGLHFSFLLMTFRQFWVFEKLFCYEPIFTLQGRMALLITLFLVLVNIFNAITTNSPKADGLNALQAWVIACIFFIFGKDWI